MLRRKDDLVDTFRMISLSACFLGVVITLFSALYPSEKFEKQMKVIFSLIFLLSIAKPIVGGSFDMPEIEEIISANADCYELASGNTEDYFFKSVERNISSMIEVELSAQNIFPEEIQTSINISETDSISINEVSVTVSDIEYADNIRKCISAYAGDEVTVTVKLREGQNAGE